MTKNEKVKEKNHIPRLILYQCPPLPFFHFDDDRIWSETSGCLNCCAKMNIDCTCVVLSLDDSVRVAQSCMRCRRSDRRYNYIQGTYKPSRFSSTLILSGEHKPHRPHGFCFVDFSLQVENGIDPNESSSTKQNQKLAVLSVEINIFHVGYRAFDNPS